jgi:hypothetical protein
MSDDPGNDLGKIAVALIILLFWLVIACIAIVVLFVLISVTSGITNPVIVFWITLAFVATMSILVWKGTQKNKKKKRT